MKGGELGSANRSERFLTHRLLEVARCRPGGGRGCREQHGRQGVRDRQRSPEGHYFETRKSMTNPNSATPSISAGSVPEFESISSTAIADD